MPESARRDCGYSGSYGAALRIECTYLILEQASVHLPSKGEAAVARGEANGKASCLDQVVLRIHVVRTVQRGPILRREVGQDEPGA